MLVGGMEFEMKTQQIPLNRKQAPIYCEPHKFLGTLPALDLMHDETNNHLADAAMEIALNGQFSLLNFERDGYCMLFKTYQRTTINFTEVRTKYVIQFRYMSDY